MLCVDGGRAATGPQFHCCWPSSYQSEAVVLSVDSTAVAAALWALSGGDSNRRM